MRLALTLETPTVAALGAPIPSGVNVSTTVTTFGPISSLDVFCVPGAYLNLEAQTTSSPVMLRAK